MIILSIVILFLSVVLFYAVAGKVEFSRAWLHPGLTRYPKITRGFGLLTFLIGLGALIQETGLMKGLLATVITWSSLASMVVLFAPFLNKLLSKNSNSEQ